MIELVQRDGNVEANRRLLKKEAEALLTKDIEAGLWHRRYGHLGKANSQKLWKNEMVGMNATLLECAKQNPCEVCLSGKQTRQPEGQRSTKVLELVHRDSL